MLSYEFFGRILVQFGICIIYEDDAAPGIGYANAFGALLDCADRRLRRSSAFLCSVISSIMVMACMG